MLDLMTLISTLGVQQELSDAQREHKANLVIRDEETQEATLVEQAADSLSSAFESFEDALSSAFGSLELGASADSVGTVAVANASRERGAHAAKLSAAGRVAMEAIRVLRLLLLDSGPATRELALGASIMASQVVWPISRAILSFGLSAVSRSSKPRLSNSARTERHISRKGSRTSVQSVNSSHPIGR